jgi:hypothetical protein
VAGVHDEVSSLTWHREGQQLEDDALTQGQEGLRREILVRMLELPA